MATDAEQIRKAAREVLDKDLAKNLPKDAPDSEYMLALQIQETRLLTLMTERIKHLR